MHGQHSTDTGQHEHFNGIVLLVTYDVEFNILSLFYLILQHFTSPQTRNSKKMYLLQIETILLTI